jgi:hypothetical protein
MLGIALSLILLAGSIDAPDLPPWPRGLSEPITAPCGTCLPADLADATNQRLLACSVLPGRCTARLVAQADALRQECASRLRLAAIERSAAPDLWWLWLSLGAVSGLGMGAVVLVAIR